MKIQIKKDSLLHGVSVVSRAVSTKNTLPILNGILLETTHEALKLRTTDLDLGIECVVAAQVLEPGKIVVPARHFNELVRRLPEITIKINKNDNESSITIRYGNSDMVINCYDAEQFPQTPPVNAKNTFHIDSDLLKKMIKQVSVTVSTDHTRPIFTGVLLETEDNLIKMVSTDTHRLSYHHGPMEKAPGEKIKAIIPGKSLTELSRLLEEDELVKVFLGDSQAQFLTTKINLITRLIEGQFPNYSQVIPVVWNTRMRLKKEDLAGATERAVLLSYDDKRPKSSIIKLDVKGNTLIITSQSPEIGRIREEIPVYTEGESAEITLNGKYLTDILKTFDSEELYLELTGSLSPAVLKPVNEDSYLALVLPVRA